MTQLATPPGIRTQARISECLQPVPFTTELVALREIADRLEALTLAVLLSQGLTLDTLDYARQAAQP